MILNWLSWYFQLTISIFCTPVCLYMLMCNKYHHLNNKYTCLFGFFSISKPKLSLQGRSSSLRFLFCSYFLFPSGAHLQPRWIAFFGFRFVGFNRDEVVGNCWVWICSFQSEWGSDCWVWICRFQSGWSGGVIGFVYFFGFGFAGEMFVKTYEEHFD